MSAPPEGSPAARCRNCGTALTDRYCGHCAQPAALAVPSVASFLRELIDKLLAVNGMLPLTLRTLLLRPGALTADYLDGRRARYVKPLNLYVAISVLFFMLLGFVPGVQLRISPWLDVETRAQPGVSLSADTGIEAVDAVAVRFMQLPDEVRQHRFRDGMLRNASRALLVLVPGFAVLLKLLYPSRLYGEHLLFSLHLHSFAFLVLPLGLIPWPAAGHGLFNDALSLWIAVYLYLALRRVYSGGRVATLARTAGIVSIYALAMAAAALGLAQFASGA